MNNIKEDIRSLGSYEKYFLPQFNIKVRRVSSNKTIKWTPLNHNTIDAFIDFLKEVKDKLEYVEDYSSLSKKCYGNTVAHEQARTGWTTDDKRVLKLKNDIGISVATLQVRNSSWRTEDPDILFIEDKFGNTVALEQVIRGWRTNNIDVLLHKNKDNESILKKQLSLGWRTSDPNILRLKHNLSSNSVFNYQINKGWIPPEEIMDCQLNRLTARETYEKFKKRKHK